MLSVVQYPAEIVPLGIVPRGKSFEVEYLGEFAKKIEIVLAQVT
jgi:hypothetical protein